MVARFQQRIQTFILVWPGDVTKIVQVGGRHIVLPPRDQAAWIGPGSPYSFEAASLKGKPIPGTVAIKDLFTETPGGGTVKSFDAYAACEYFKGRVDLVGQGFGICMDPEDVSELMEAGLPLWDQSQYAQAEEIIQNELARRAAFKAKGNVPPPLDSSQQRKLDWALAMQRKRNTKAPQISDDELRGAISGQLPEEVAAARNANATLSVTEIFQQVRNVGLKLSKPELEALLIEDAPTMQNVLERIAIAKREALEKGEPVPATSE